MDRSSLLFFSTVSLYALVLVSCNSAPGNEEASSGSSLSIMEQQSSSSMTATGGVMMDGSSSSVHSSSVAGAMMRQEKSSAAAAAMGKSSPAAEQTTRIITVDVTNWAFTPDVITVKKGEKVELRFTSNEGIHGVAIPGLQINERIDPGAMASVHLSTDTAGTFDFFCSIPCGPGHKDMKGIIVIE